MSKTTDEAKDWVPQPGDYVFYMDHARVQNGRIKSIYGDYAFVVYSCAGQWDDYKAYTGQRTSLHGLRQGWADKDGNPIDTPGT